MIQNPNEIAARQRMEEAMSRIALLLQNFAVAHVARRPIGIPRP